MEKHCRRQHKNTKSVDVAAQMHHHYQNLVTKDIGGIIIDTASYANYVVTYISNLLTTSLPVIYNVFARFNYEKI